MCPPYSLYSFYIDFDDEQDYMLRIIRVITSIRLATSSSMLSALPIDNIYVS